MNIETLELKTFISRAGNKSRHIKHFIDYIPKEYNTYIEPFVGSGALFLYLKPRKWIINDINEDLINVWNLILNNYKYIIKYLKIFGITYLKIRTDNEKILFLKNKTDEINKIKVNNDNKKITLWLILTKMSFMGTLKLNKNTYSFCKINNYKSQPIIIKQEYFDLLKNINYYLNNTNGKIYNIDYKEILKKSKQNDFIFLDPPYIELKSQTKHNYNFNQNLTNNFLQELYTEVKKLDKKGVKWMMTQENIKEVRDTFKEYKIRKYKVYRIFLKKYVYELFITNY